VCKRRSIAISLFPSIATFRASTASPACQYICKRLSGQSLEAAVASDGRGDLWRPQSRKNLSTEEAGRTSRPRVRRETGRRRGCKSLTMKGRANRIVPESCVAGCEARDEALTGVTVGQVLSRESPMFRDADAVCGAEGSTVGRVTASALPVPRGLRPWHAVETFCLGTGRSHDWPCCKGRPALGRPEGRSQ